MKRDKEWLKNEVSEMSYTVTNIQGDEEYVGVSKIAVLILIDQLEEPEQDKVVIPQFVADWMNKRKQNFKTSHDAILYIHSYGWDDEMHIDFQLYKWIPDNVATFARAWLDGYSVEKKRKYVVEDNKVALLCKFDGKVMPVSETIQDGLHHESLDYELTETEIKDYDERYWAFAEEVTE